MSAPELQPEPQEAGDGEPVPDTDQFAASFALGAGEPLTVLNRAGALDAADIHVAVTLTKLMHITDPAVQQAAALTVAATRAGNSFIDLAATAQALELGREWPQRVAACRKLTPEQPDARTPLRLEGTRLYLDRYWRAERRLAAALRTRNRMRADVGDLAALGEQIRASLGPSATAEQELAVAVAMLRDLAVLAGGPGTGKTTLVARLVELLVSSATADGRPQPLIALCAPTGKAAARLSEAVGATEPASTIHRLLGWLPGGQFRHNDRNRLPHDVVIVDETSMAPLWLMVKLVEAVRDDARLVLVGDPDQLSAIEVGAVLRAIVGPAAQLPQLGRGMRGALQRVTGHPVAGNEQARGFGDAVVVLRRGHRSVESIDRLAQAIRAGDADGVTAALAGGEAITWLGRDARDGDAVHNIGPLREAAVTAFAPMVAAARRGDGPGALRLLGTFRLLCAHRQGPYGMTRWAVVVQSWLRDSALEFDAFTDRPPGLPLLATRNDYELQLRNGDTGVVISDGDHGALAVFDTASGSVRLAPSRLTDVEPLFATTVHRSQGSEFEVVALILPEPGSPLLTRELLYTAVTRARSRLILVGSQAAVRTAVIHPSNRATGLGELLW
ncbi:MAG: exodeoxyribonuclease V subunit alpha [Solirubrobacteraceae bacterium]